MSNVEYKEYIIHKDSDFGFFKVKQMGSGKVSKNLTGTYTTVNEARKGIDMAINVAKRGKDVKKSSSGGDK